MENPYAVSLKNKDGSFKDGVLYIGTEMDLETEINPILIAYVADVPEEHIRSGKYEIGEEDRGKMASIILEK